MANRASGRNLPAGHVCCCIPATADQIMDTITQVEDQLAPPPAKTYKFSISADPSDATVKINGTTQSSITVQEGTSVTYEVSKGILYNAVRGSYTVNSDYTLNVHLEVDIELRVRNSASIPTNGGEVTFGVIVHSTGSYMNAEAYDLVSSAPWLSFARVDNTNYYMTASSNTGDARESRISLYLKEEFWDEYQGQHQYYKELYGVELDFVTVSQAALIRDSIRLTPGATDMRFREAGHELLNPLSNIIEESQIEDWEVCGTLIPWGYLDDPIWDEPINKLCEYECNVPGVIIEPGEPDNGSHLYSRPGGYFWIPKGVPDETNLIFTATWPGAGSEGQDLSASIERIYYKYLKYSGLNVEYVSKDIDKLQFKATVSERKMTCLFEPGEPEYAAYMWKWEPQTSVIDVTSDPRLTWSVVSPSGVTSDGNGLFTIPYSVEDGATITVEATFTKDDEFDNYSLTDQASTTYEQAADPILRLLNNSKMTGSPENGYSVSGIVGDADSTEQFTWDVENPRPDGHFVLLDENDHIFYEDYEDESGETEGYSWYLDAPKMFRIDGVTGYRGTGETGEFSIQIGENPLVNGLIPDPATITARYYYNNDTQYVDVSLTFNYSANPKLADVTCTISRNWEGLQTFSVPTEGGNVSLQMTAELVNHTTPGYFSTNSFNNYTPTIIAYDQSTWNDYKGDNSDIAGNYIDHTEENYPVIGPDGSPVFIYNFQDYELTTVNNRLRGSDVKSHPEILTFECLLENDNRALKYNIIFTIPENTSDKSRGNHIRFVTTPGNLIVNMPSGAGGSTYYISNRHETPIIPDWDFWDYEDGDKTSHVDHLDFNIVQEADEPVDETDTSGLKFTALYTNETPGSSSQTLWDSTKPSDPIQTITVPASGGELIIDVEKRLVDENGVVEGLTVTDGSRDQGDSFNSNIVTALHDINDTNYLAKFGNDLKPVVGADGQGRWIWTPENAQESTTSGADLLPTYNATVNVYDEPGVGWTRITITVPENTTGERRGNDIVIIDRCTLSYTSQNLGETMYVNEREQFINGYNEENPYYDPSLGGSSGSKYYPDDNRYGYFIIEQEA